MKIDSSKNPLKKYSPSAGKSWLCILSGLMWSGVGIFLCTLTVPWFRLVDLGLVLIYILVGVILAVGINYFGFSPFAVNNI